MKLSVQKISLLFFSLSLLMRLGALASFAEEKSLLYVNDSYTYLQVTKNILEHGVYSMEISETPHADNFRTPLYPLFLLPFVWLKTSLYIPAILQSIIMSAGIAFFYTYSRKIWGEWPALIGSFLFALEPMGALISGQILTEAIFTPLFIFGVLNIVNYVKTTQIRYLGYGGGLLALASLARPAAFYLFLTFPVAVLLVKTNWRIFLRHSAIGLLIFFLVVSPWMYYLIFKLHTWSFSSIIKMQVYEYHARYLDEWRYARDSAITDRLPKVDLSPINETLNAAAIPPVQAVGEAYLKAHFKEYLAYHFTRIPQIFIDSGYSTLLHGVSFLHFDNSNLARGGFIDQFDSIKAAYTGVKEEPLLLVVGLADLFFFIMATLALLNPILYYYVNRKFSRETLYLVFFLACYAVIVAPISDPRFRIPINGFLFVLAVQSLGLIKRFNKSEVSKSQIQ